MQNSNLYLSKIKQPPVSWEEGRAKTFTFVITEDCQLKCKYCYVVGKNTFNKMTFEMAKNCIDFILNEKELIDEKSLIVDFIGGEPFLEIDLIDKISDYMKIKMYELDHPWFNSYRFSFSTNGLLYSSKKVQDYIQKNRSHISVGITLDGTREKHDINRVFKDNTGSYDEVVKNIPLWLKQFPDASTKVTVSSDDIPYIKDSIIHLWSLGITYVNINVVFENVWKENDDERLYNQLIELADYIIDNDLYSKYYCSFFTDSIGKPVTDNQNWCGSGKKMIAIDYKGDFYPCNRFLPFTLNDSVPRSIGNYKTGIDYNKLRPFLALDMTTQSSKECMECEVASGCALCVGLNYDSADTDTIYQRATYICKMHKARVKANDYYWKKLINKCNIQTA